MSVRERGIENTAIENENATARGTENGKEISGISETESGRGNESEK